MESFRTMIRLVVMSAALYLGYKCWQLYGPPADRLKSLALRVVEIAQSALSEERAPAAGSPPLATAPQALSPPGVPGPVLQSQSLVPIAGPFAGAEASPIAPPPLTAINPPANSPASPAPDSLDAGLAPLYGRLEQLGVHKRELAPWGDSGQLVRFACQASVGDSPAFSRHFESYAAQPREAVEQVLAKLEAWRTTQRNADQLGGALR